jgi:hypothetical protein
VEAVHELEGERDQEGEAEQREGPDGERRLPGLPLNFLGVMASTGAVAYSVVTLLPVELILQVGSGAGYAAPGDAGGGVARRHQLVGEADADHRADQRVRGRVRAGPSSTGRRRATRRPRPGSAAS